VPSAECDNNVPLETDGPDHEERSRSIQNGAGQGDLRSLSSCNGIVQSDLRTLNMMNDETNTITSRRNRVFNTDNSEENNPEVNEETLETNTLYRRHNGDRNETSPNTQTTEPSTVRHNDGGASNEISDEQLYVGTDDQFSTSHNDEEDVSREMEEMLRLGTFNQKQAGEMRSKRNKQIHLNSISRWKKHDNSDIGMKPFNFDSDGVPLNWTEDDILANMQSHGVNYRLVDLHPGQVEYEMINGEFEATGLEVTKVQRLQNRFLLERFKSEMEEVKRRQHSGK